VPGANATTVYFDYTSSCPTCAVTSGSGVLTTTALGGGEYLVTADSIATEVLVPGTYLGNDNILYYPGLPNYYDSLGISELFDGVDLNFACPTASGSCYYTYLGTSYLGTITISPTPLPSTWLMLLGGFVGLGFFAYRGMKNNSAALAAA